MNKKLFSLILVALLLCSINTSVFAQSYSYAGSVTFTSAGKMDEKDFNLERIFELVEPGDDAKYDVKIINAHSRTTRWYMSNSVIRSLEENAAQQKFNGISNGAYSYKLTYNGPGGSQVLFNSKDKALSDYVGGGGQSGGSGQSLVGLHEATSNLEDFFFLDTLNSGESGTVSLEVELEGETIDNRYQETAAEIHMNFAVELSNPNNPSTSTAVKTGDENNLTPYYIGMIIAGLLLLYFALDAYTDRKYKKGRS